MTRQRYNPLMRDPDPVLTAVEIAKGWHWCCEFDVLLVGPGMGEMDFCMCEYNDGFKPREAADKK